jgi:hypothetical protein
MRSNFPIFSGTWSCIRLLASSFTVACLLTPSSVRLAFGAVGHVPDVPTASLALPVGCQYICDHWDTVSGKHVCVQDRWVWL